MMTLQDTAALVAQIRQYTPFMSASHERTTKAWLEHAASALERLQADLTEARKPWEEREDAWRQARDNFREKARLAEQDREALLAVARAAQTGVTKVEAEPAISGAARAAYWDLYNTVRYPLAALPAHLRKELTL